MNESLTLGKLICHAKTDRGKKREVNEDHYLLAPWEDKSAILAVVADGMGGHKGGEIASKIAIETFQNLLKQPLPSERYEKYELLLKTFYDVDEAIQERSGQDFRLINMGTTIVAAIITPIELIHLYAGDCRLYHFMAKGSPYITTDHSVVQVLIELGKITYEEISTHPMRSVVNSCLGGRRESQLLIDPKQDGKTTPFRELHPGDLLLLSSDGLHGEISPEQLESVVEKFRTSPKRLTEACVEVALNQGGNDNITIIAIQLENIENE